MRFPVLQDVEPSGEDAEKHGLSLVLGSCRVGLLGRVSSCRIEFPTWQQAQRGWICTTALMDYRENSGERSAFGLFSRRKSKCSLWPFVEPWRSSSSLTKMGPHGRLGIAWCSLCQKEERCGTQLSGC